MRRITALSERECLLYFENKSVPPLALLVSGGRLSEASVPRIERIIEENLEGKTNFPKVPILEAEAGAGAGDSARAKVVVVDAVGELDALTNDVPPAVDHRGVERARVLAALDAGDPEAPGPEGDRGAEDALVAAQDEGLTGYAVPSEGREPESPRACATRATASFWRGVDVPGRALRLVVMDELPFDVPTDPIVAARTRMIEEEGENAFSSYLVPVAALALEQS